jgi:hypothetical protein
MTDPSPDNPCLPGWDHRISPPEAGCPGCGRLPAVCARRSPCQARRSRFSWQLARLRLRRAWRRLRPGPGPYEDQLPRLAQSPVKTCACGYSTNNRERFEAHQEDRKHEGRQGENFAAEDISELTVDDLREIKLQLERTLSDAGPYSAVGIAIVTQIRAIDTELKVRPDLQAPSCGPG